MIVPPLKFDYTVSYDPWLAHVSKFFKKFNYLLVHAKKI